MTAEVSFGECHVCHGSSGGYRPTTPVSAPFSRLTPVVLGAMRFTRPAGPFSFLFPCPIFPLLDTNVLMSGKVDPSIKQSLAGNVRFMIIIV